MNPNNNEKNSNDRNARYPIRSLRTRKKTD